MSNKVVVIISTGEAEKARTGVLYAVNALRQNWMESVALIFFGPAEALLLENSQLQAQVELFQEQRGEAVACQYIADNENLSSRLTALGVEVRYVGKLISDLIKEGYTPMVW